MELIFNIFKRTFSGEGKEGGEGGEGGGKFRFDSFSNFQFTVLMEILRADNFLR